MSTGRIQLANNPHSATDVQTHDGGVEIRIRRRRNRRLRTVTLQCGVLASKRTGCEA
jgi:hypothetical protein